MIVKVCGMKYPDNIEAVLKLNPDYLGFIFYPKSPRYIIDENPDLSMIPASVGRIGVFVNEEIDIVEKMVDTYELTGVQLHGNESAEICNYFKSKGLTVFKAFGINEEFDFTQLNAYEGIVDLFVFDTKVKSHGGSGKKFDWQLLDNYKIEIPFLLSGGISKEDAHGINHLKHPSLKGVDLNSKFEIKPGLKDVELLSQFLSELREKNNIDMSNKYQADSEGFYGEFGGAYIPEMLQPNVDILCENYLRIIESEKFKKEYFSLLKDYVGRPTPLFYAQRLSDKYGCHIYLKREDLAHTGAHKVNNTIGQILLAKELGKERIIAETGAGQHGVATATVCALMGMKCVVYMGETDIKRQAPNVARMKMLGAEVRAAVCGNKTLKDATNEAIRDWINNPEDTFYIIGSVVGPHPYPDMVARFQAIISEEIRSQLKEQTGSELPDYVIACVGGGSNAAGAFYHYLDEESVKLVAVEASGLGVFSGETAATTSIGETGVIHGSKTLLMQDEDGQIVEPYSISAGLDYPGIGPFHAHLFKSGRAQFLDATDEEALQAAFRLTKLEGIIPALESSHALASLEKITFNSDDVVVVNVSGRGDKDMETYMNVMDKYI